VAAALGVERIDAHQRGHHWTKNAAYAAGPVVVHDLLNVLIRTTTGFLRIEPLEGRVRWGLLGLSTEQFAAVDGATDGFLSYVFALARARRDAADGASSQPSSPPAWASAAPSAVLPTEPAEDASGAPYPPENDGAQSVKVAPGVRPGAAPFVEPADGA
jgi:hypothetical protein